MLDVHPPHEPVHSWKGFLVHIAAICVGLLLAVSLEQTVEAIHRHHQRAELRDDLHAESQQVLADVRRAEASEVYELAWLKTRIAQVRAAVWDRQPLLAAAPNHRPYSAAPDIPIWRSAKAAGRTSLLSKGEVNAYGEVEYVQMHLETLNDIKHTAENARISFDQELPSLADGEPDFGKTSPEDVRRYLSLLAASAVAIHNYLAWARVVEGAEIGVIDGKTRVEDLYMAEKKVSAAGTAAEERDSP